MSNQEISFVRNYFWEYADKIRGNDRFDMNVAMAWLSILYCVAHDCKVTVEHTMYSTARLVFSDSILEEHPVLRAITEASSLQFDASFLPLMEKMSHESGNDSFKESYPHSVDAFFAFLPRFFGKSGMVDYIQPVQVTDIITHFIKGGEYKSLYNPFAGLCSYPIALDPDVRCYAQELNPITRAFSLVRLDAYSIRNTEIALEDSISHWNPRGADAIVATMPFGLKLSYKYSEYLPFLSPDVKSGEDFFFNQVMTSGPTVKKAITVVPRPYCYSPSGNSMMKKLCMHGYLDTVIELPSGVFNNTALKTSIIVLSLDSKRNTVRFVNAETLCRKFSNQEVILDADHILNVIDTNDAEYVKEVRYEELEDQGFVLVSTLYLNSNLEGVDGNDIVRFGSLITYDPGIAVNHTGQSEKLISREDLSDNLYTILHPGNRPLPKRVIKYCRQYSGKKLIAYFLKGGIKLYFHNSDEDFYAQQDFFVFSVNEDLTTYPYIALYFLKDKDLSAIFSEICAARSKSLFRTIEALRIQLGDLRVQEEDVKRRLDEEDEMYRQERDAEDARRGFSRATSDLGHMLGFPIKRQNDIIESLSMQKQGTDKYYARVKALVDVSQYIQRIVNITGGDLSKAEFFNEELNISSFVNKYLEACKNFGRTETYDIVLEDNTQSDILVDADPDMLMVLFDTVLENAWRHSFNKGTLKVEGGNEVRIRVSPVVFNEGRYVQISFMNNGAPIAPSFTIHDYITRRRYNAKTGRSGLGGNHVYNITNRLNGILSLRTDKEWPFILDVLLPVAASTISDFSLTYYSEDYV